MKLTIELNENTILATITELEAKGCYEVAEAIEKAYEVECAKEVIRDIKKEFHKEWQMGHYFKHTNGNITCVYYNYKTRKYHTSPVYIANKLMGRASTCSEVQFKIARLEEMGFEEV